MVGVLIKDRVLSGARNRVRLSHSSHNMERPQMTRKEWGKSRGLVAGLTGL